MFKKILLSIIALSYCAYLLPEGKPTSLYHKLVCWDSVVANQAHALVNSLDAYMPANDIRIREINSTYGDCTSSCLSLMKNADYKKLISDMLHKFEHSINTYCNERNGYWGMYHYIGLLKKAITCGLSNGQLQQSDLQEIFDNIVVPKIIPEAHYMDKTSAGQTCHMLDFVLVNMLLKIFKEHAIAPSKEILDGMCHHYKRLNKYHNWLIQYSYTDIEDYFKKENSCSLELTPHQRETIDQYIKQKFVVPAESLNAELEKNISKEKMEIFSNIFENTTSPFNVIIRQAKPEHIDAIKVFEYDVANDKELSKKIDPLILASYMKLKKIIDQFEYDCFKSKTKEVVAASPESATKFIQNSVIKDPDFDLTNASMDQLVAAWERNNPIPEIMRPSKASCDKKGQELGQALLNEIAMLKGSCKGQTCEVGYHK